MKLRIFTLFPEKFPGPLNFGIYKKAFDKNLWKLEIVNIRDYASDKNKTVDDTPYGGGSGMVIRPDVISKALDKNINYKNNERIIFLSPRGKKFDQSLAKKLSKESTINLLCGHFEGIDQRVLETRGIEEISVGDFVLSNGETASFVVADTIIRLLARIRY